MSYDDAMEGLLFEKMKKFISTVDELRDFGLQSYIDLPRIAVVGLQSAGKSSLLESIVGYDFLPRGQGICTRRPLELRLVHSNEAEKPYAEFEKFPKEYITDFEEVKRRIVQLTDKEAGVRKGIIEEPIILTITAKSVPDLSMVDLPGITKIPVKGSDHTDDIEKLTTDLIRKYIKNERTIILCVMQANVDVSTSDAIKLSRKYDPKGERTICALTKIDLIGPGQDIRHVINNNEVQLKYGYVAVKGRSPADMQVSMTVAEGLEKEEEFFDLTYPDLVDNEQVGTRVLVNKLSAILGKNIQTGLPTIIKELRSKIDDFKEELQSLGTPMPESNAEKVQQIQLLIMQFCEAYKSSIKGRYSKIKKDQEKQPIGVKIRTDLNNIFMNYDLKKIDKILTDKIIKATFVNYGSSGLPGYPPFSAFQNLLVPLLQELIPISTDLVDTIYFMLESTIQEIVQKIFFRFPELKTLINDYAVKNLTVCRDETETMVNYLLEAELGYLYTSDEEYLMFHGSILPPRDPNDPNQSMGDAFIKETRERVKDYFYLVFRNLRDNIPKTIGQMMLNNSSDKMQMYLFDAVNKDQSAVTESLSDPDYIVKQRKDCRQALRVLKNCLKKLQEEDLIEETEYE